MKATSPILLVLLLFTFCTDLKQSEPEIVKYDAATCSTVQSISGDSLLSDFGLDLSALKMPAGFRISIYGRVKDARAMAMSPSGTLFIGGRGSKTIKAFRDYDGDYKVDELFILDTALRMPTGVAFRDGDLYVADVSNLWVYEDIEENLCNPKKRLIYEDYPSEGHHGWKYIAFGPDGKLYVPVGAPCNICESEDSIYASITRMDFDGTNRELYVSGVRNTVGFTWHPETGEMWFTDNGRDVLGDSIPPCELNRVSEMGQHFGYPYCHGGYIPDPEFGEKYPCEDFIAPAQKLNPHVAPLGLKFYTGNMFPESYKGKILIAEHGSWNRTPEAGHTGHMVTMVTEQNGQGVDYQPFIEGFLNKATNVAWGRPVDILILEDGSMLLSDDKGGVVYRVTYNAQ